MIIDGFVASERKKNIKRMEEEVRGRIRTLEDFLITLKLCYHCSVATPIKLTFIKGKKASMKFPDVYVVN